MIQKDRLKKKTFAVDIDGTITLNGMGTVHLGALSKLRSLKEAGHNVILVTGR
ncbi:MAG: HAD hydrolase family protein, partial [Bacteroidetes bacterium]|nr:HAD hydrolase family protein [Bacteroidota bacterium]